MLASNDDHQDSSFVGKTHSVIGEETKREERIIPDTKLGGYEFWKSIGSPKHIVAPMVDQSELGRLLVENASSTMVLYFQKKHSEC